MRTNLNVTFGPPAHDREPEKRQDRPRKRKQEHGNKTVAPSIAVSVEEAAALLSIGRTSMFKILREDGELPSFHIGRRRLILREDITAYVNKQVERANSDR
ncbi:MAG: hypothetical protein CL802_15890 [Citromicrobium sp.]|nr:hypothetical protein [Citromicrobium sp.]|tara:strand:- start:8101 stop:8403 length:303 start_codon:yes stop_codon:yes gene_type:complete